MTIPAVEARLVMVEHDHPALLIDYVTPAPAVSYTAPALLIDNVLWRLPRPTLRRLLVDERIAPQPVVTDATPAPVVENDAPTLSVSHAASTSNALAPPERVMLSGAARVFVQSRISCRAHEAAM